MKNKSIFIASVLMLSGCGSFLKSQDNIPQLNEPLAWDSSLHSGYVTNIHLLNWWTLFQDKKLNNLIDESLNNNPDLAIAAYNIQQAGLQSDLANTNITPNVSSTLGGSSTRLLDRKSPSVRTFQSSTSLSYELDLWGKMARQRDLSWWQYNATIYDRMSVRLTLISNVANAYWNIGQINEQIENLKLDIKDAKKDLDITQDYYNLGGKTYADLALSKYNLYEIESNLQNLLSQRELQRKTLTILLARVITIKEISEFNLSDSKPFKFNPPMPIKVLLNRPDIAAAAARVKMQISNYDMQKASMFPTITLNGSVSTTGTMLGNILKNPSGLLGLGISFPFLQLNTVRLNIKLSESEYKSSLISYKKAWYQALAEVNEALNIQSNLRSQYEYSLMQNTEAKQATIISRSRYFVGKGSLRDLLSDETSLRQVESDTASIKNQLLQSNMGLIVSVGGLE